MLSFNIIFESAPLVNLKMYRNVISKKLIPAYFCLLFFLLSQPILCYNVSFDQFIKSTPTTFGLITVTHARNGIYKYFREHIDSYGGMDCPEVTQISVVWNNDVDPESVGFKQSQKWKRPVYFIKTPYNSMDFRYMVPKESKAQVFFSIDDDILIDCEYLRKGFAIWRSKAVGDIGPLVGYGARGFNYNLKNQSYVYADPRQKKYFSISLTGISWVSRFFFQLYNTQKIWEINSMREYVKLRNNCDDIALNFIVSYFFPELIPVGLDKNETVVIQAHPYSQALMKTHYPYRTQCLKKFSQILGYNPLRIVDKNDPENQKRFTSVVSKYAIYMKKKQLSERFLEDGKNKKLSIEQMMELVHHVKEELTQKHQISQQKNVNENVNGSLVDQILLLKQQLQKTKSEYDSVLQQISQIQQKPRLTEQSGKDLTEKSKPQEINVRAQQNPEIEVLRSSVDLVFKFTVFVAASVIGLGFYMIKNFCAQRKQRNRNKERRPKKDSHRQSGNKYSKTSELSQIAEQEVGELNK